MFLVTSISLGYPVDEAASLDTLRYASLYSHLISRMTFAQVPAVGRPRAISWRICIHAQFAYPYWVRSGHTLPFDYPHARFHGKARAFTGTIFRLHSLGLRIRCIPPTGYRIEAPRGISEASRENDQRGEGTAYLQGKPQAVIFSRWIRRGWPKLCRTREGFLVRDAQRYRSRLSCSSCRHSAIPSDNSSSPATTVFLSQKGPTPLYIFLLAIFRSHLHRFRQTHPIQHP